MYAMSITRSRWGWCLLAPLADHDGPAYVDYGRTTGWDPTCGRPG